MKKNSLFVVCAAILIVNVILVEGKRSFSIGRSRKKAPNINVRRKGAVPDVKPPVASGPDYSAASVARPSSGFDAPPSYASVARGNPPSYAEATRGANYPRQTYSSNGGNFQSRGSNSASAYGLGSPQSPNHGLYSGPQTAGGGGMMGGYYGGGYGYGSSSPFGIGNVLTGLAVWNLARGFNSHHGRTEHIYIEHKRDQSKDEAISPAQEAHPEISDGSPTLLTTIVPRLEPISPLLSTSDATTPQPHVEYTTDHPSLWIYAINTVPIRTEVVVANKSSFD